MKLSVATALFSLLTLSSCTHSSGPAHELWIYTSLYKDTVADIQPKLEKALAATFPGTKINVYQAGSEEVAAKINAEELAGGTHADLVIFSDRFWFEEMARKGRLHKYAPPGSERVDPALRHSGSLYSAVSFPLMVMIYNSEAVPAPPRSFKEMAEPKWKSKFSTGSPLASGTNFTTVAFLQKAYGWDYFKALRKNDTISEGGNSAVIRRVQTKERPVGWVLLENALRLTPSPDDPTSKIKVIYPEDGSILQTNVLAILAKGDPANRAPAERAADWFFGSDGQAAMARSYMYGAVPGTPSPKGAPALEPLIKNAPKWTPALVDEFMQGREKIKEEFARIMLQ